MAHRPPSRVKYEANNPTVSFRVSLEEREQLDRIREETGRSFADMIKAGAGILEDEHMKALHPMNMRNIELGRCNECGGAFHWDLTSPRHRQKLSELVSKSEGCHSWCKP